MAGTPVDFTMNTLMHKSFKRELDRIKAGVAALQADPSANAAGLVKRWDFFSDQLAHHHQGEDKFIWPLVRERSKVPAEIVIIDAMESEHGALDAQMSVINGLFGSLRDGSEVDLADLQKQLDDLGVIITGHCDHEERDGARIAAQYVQKDDLDEFHKFTRSGTTRASSSLGSLTAPQRTIRRLPGVSYQVSCG